MNEKKDSALKRYFKENFVVLLFELIIVVLLSCICSLMLGGEPVWLAPVLAVFAYLMAELRFMMAYVAGSARQESKAEETEEQPREALPPEREPTEEMLGETPDDILQEDEEQADDDEEAPFVPPVLRHAEEMTDTSLFDEPMLDEDDPDEDEQELSDEIAEEPMEMFSEESLDEPSFVSAELSWEQEDFDTVELEDVLPEEQEAPSDLLEADIDLFDEPDGTDDDLSDEDIYNIFSRTAPCREQPVSFDAPQQDDFLQEVSTPADDEDPFSH